VGASQRKLPVPYPAAIYHLLNRRVTQDLMSNPFHLVPEPLPMPRLGSLNLQSAISNPLPPPPRRPALEALARRRALYRLNLAYTSPALPPKKWTQIYGFEKNRT
jgi:hypothetical protein